jgi:hypothetical protein
MHFVVATLCDAVNVREGLPNILSAGLSKLTRASYPSPLGISAVCMVQVPPAELAVSRKITVEVRSLDRSDLRPHARFEGGWESIDRQDDRLPAGVNLIFNLEQVPIPEPGYYEVWIEIDGLEPRALPFRADLIEDGPAEQES